MILVTVPSRNWPSGTRETPASERLDPSWTRLRIALARENWPATVQVTMALDVSLDDGVTWAPVGSATTTGGVILDRDGQPLAQSWVSFQLRDVGNPLRRVRGTFSNSGGFRAAVTIEAT